MASAVQPARGFRDYLPSDKRKREAVLASIRRSFYAFGFREIETPAMEPLERLQSSEGGENEKLIFKVLRRGLDRDEQVTVSDACDLGLRYDLTVPLVRFHATNGHALPSVFRAMQIGPVWRAERPQKGRYRQFLQCDIDILGEPSIQAEVELVNGVLFALEELGIEGCTVRLNDRRILDSMLAAFGIEPAMRPGALITIDKLDKIGVEGVCDALAASGLSSDAVGGVRTLLQKLEAGEGIDPESVAGVLPEGLDPEGMAAVIGIRAAVLASNPAGVSVVFDPTLVRGMGYYTGPIFEVAHPSSTSSICGGGRYDAMAERLSGRTVPAVGFSIGFERVVGLVDEARLNLTDSVIAILHTDAATERLAALQARFIRRGQPVVVARKAKNMSKQLTDLGAQGVTHFCMVEGEFDPDDEPEMRSLTR